MEYKDLTAEQKKKLDACETAEDILALAQEEGVELTPEQIEMIDGGFLDGVFRTDNENTSTLKRWRDSYRN